MEASPKAAVTAAPSNLLPTDKFQRFPDGSYVLPIGHVLDCWCRCPECSAFRDAPEESDDDGAAS